MGIIPPIPMQPISQLKPPSAPAKPAAPGKTQQETIPDFARDQFAAKEKSFMDQSVLSHKEVKSLTLLSEYGFFKIFDYELNIPKVKTVTQRTVFFVNKESKTVVETHGHIALNWLSIIPDRAKVIDFPIWDERPLRKNSRNKISRFSFYTLDWDSGTFKVTKKPYLNFDPPKEDKLIAFNEEYDIDKSIVFTNWKSVLSSGTYKAYAKSRTLRKSGTPRQILLHETATKTNLAITGARLDDDGVTYLIPHFCVNKPENNKGSIIQFVDVAENVAHGEVMNDRSVGIEFVNAPIEAFKKDQNDKDVAVFKLAEAKDGLYLNTVITGFAKLFIPLEFSAEKADNNFELEIPKKKLANVAALKLLEIDKKKIVTEEKDKIKIKYCKAERFEHLVSLINVLAGRDILHLDLTDFNTWKCFVKEKDETYFVFHKAFQATQTDGDHYAFDIRRKGIWCHGFTGHHADGYLPALYTFLRLFNKLKPEATLKKLIDLLINGTTTKIKRSVILKYQNRIISEFSGSKEIEIQNCLLVK